ncbi:MAG: Gfo/Idh/MocA family oxidoreductase [Anaerolineae bacterium]
MSANSSQTPVRVAVIGAGFVATKGHLPALARNPDTQIVALVDVNAARAAEVARTFDIPATYSDYVVMLREVAPDLVIVGTPNLYHAPVSVDALNAGAHVLCEKPMALTVADAQAMAEAARRNNRLLTIGVHNRFRPEAEFLKHIIDDGQLGRVYYAKVTLFRRRGIPGFGSWFTNRDMAGAGALFDIGVHMVDLAVWLMGSPRPVSVMGATYSEFGPRGLGLGGWGADAPTAGQIPQGARFDVDDLAAGFARFENGATLIVDISWAAHVPSEERLLILGTDAGAELYIPDRFGSTAPPLRVYHDYAGQPTESFPSIPGLPASETAQSRQLANIVAAIRGQAPLRTTAEQSIEVTAILAALQESAAQQRSSEITLPAGESLRG